MQVGFLETVTETMQTSKARREAIDAVRAMRVGKTRSELRLRLKEELSIRDVSIDRQAAEATVDVITAGAETFGAARFVARGIRDLLRVHPKAGPYPKPETQCPELNSTPDREPRFDARPEQAAYPLGYESSTRRAPVELDASAYAFLDSVTDRRVVQIWLTWDIELPQTVARLNVYIGAERVGQLGANAANYFRPAMEAAAERDEDPWTSAYLTPTFGAASHILTVGLPNTASEESE